MMRPMFALIALIFLVRNILLPLAADDYSYAFIWDGAGRGNILAGVPDTIERVDSVGDLIKSQWSHYMTWGGRTPAHTLIQIFVWAGKGLFDVLNTLMFAALIVLIARLADVRLTLRSLLWIALGLWLAVPEWISTMQWLTGACNYLWQGVFQLLFLKFFSRPPALFAHSRVDERRGDDCLLDFPCCESKSDQIEPLKCISRPPASYSLREPLSTIAVQEPLSTLAAQEPRSTIAAQEPSSTIAAQEPLSTFVVREPLSTLAAQEPLSTLAAQEPSSTLVVREPLSTLAAQEQSSTAAQGALLRAGGWGNKAPQGIIPFGLLAGWSNEAGGLATLFIALCLIIERKKIRLNEMLGLLSFAVGYGLLMLAPGNLNRLHLTEPDFALSTALIIEHLRPFFDVIANEILLLIPIAICLIKGRSTFAIKIFSTAGLLVPTVMLFSPAFPLRSCFMSAIFLLIASTAAIERLGLERWELKKYFAPLIAVGLLWALSVAGSLYSDVSMWRQMERRLELIAELRAEPLIKVPPLNPTRRLEKFLGLRIFGSAALSIGGELSNNPKEGHNVTFAKYHGIKAIAVERHD